MRLVKAMFLERAPGGAPAVQASSSVLALLAVFALPSLVLGVWWSPLADLAARALGH
jgi:NADH:ubiquinone oxidoreductase subunit 2 (subunit N)